MTTRTTIHANRQPPVGVTMATSAATACWVAACAMFLGACQSAMFRTVDLSPPERITEEIPEAHLLNVGIAVFDPNAPDSYDAAQQSTINPEVRRAEAYYMPYLLKSVMESTGNWGAVRVVPGPTHAVDLLVEARIVMSQGERLVLDVDARDARGVPWLHERYEALASKYGYGEAMPSRADPFQHVYTRIADDLAARFVELTGPELRQIRGTAEMRFAQELVPAAYHGYVERTADGRNRIIRLPAANDPTMGKVRQVREREFLFIDTLEDHYAEYHRLIQPLYHVWRKSAYNESMAKLELRNKRRRQVLVGTISLVAGVAGGPATFTAIPTGAEMLKDSFAKQDEIGLHTEALREISSSMESEVMPHTLELENKTVELSGTVEEQYAKLREILRADYYESLDLAPEPASPTPGETAGAVPSTVVGNSAAASAGDPPDS